MQVLTYAVGNSIKKTDDNFKAVQVQGTAIVDGLNRDKLTVYQALLHTTVVKECLNAAAETLLEGKQRDELCEKIKQIPMWAATTTRKSEMLSDDTLSQLHAAVQSAPSLAIDESSDVTDNAQLLVYVRLFHQDKKDLWGPVGSNTTWDTVLLTWSEGLMLFLFLFEM